MISSNKDTVVYLTPLVLVNFPTEGIIYPYCASLCNSISRQAIELESCWNPQKLQQFFWFALKNIVFCGSDVTSGVGFRPFWLRLPGSGH